MAPIRPALLLVLLLAGCALAQLLPVAMASAEAAAKAPAKKPVNVNRNKKPFAWAPTTPDAGTPQWAAEEAERRRLDELLDRRLKSICGRC